MVALMLPTLPRVTLRCPNGPLCAPYGGLHFARTLQPVFKIDANLVTVLILCTSAAKSQALTWHTDGTSNAGGWHTDITSTAGAMAPSRQNSTYKPKATSTATSDKMERCTSNNPMKALLSFFFTLIVLRGFLSKRHSGARPFIIKRRGVILQSHVACTFVCVYVHVWVRTCARTHFCVCARTCVCMRVCVCACVCVCVGMCVCVRLRACLCIHMHACVRLRLVNSQRSRCKAPDLLTLPRQQSWKQSVNLLGRCRNMDQSGQDVERSAWGLILGDAPNATLNA